MKKFFIVLAALCLLMTAVMGVLSVSAATIKYGDVDGNGEVTNKDLGLLQRYVNGWKVTIDLEAADVNADGVVTNKDLGLLQRYVNGWDVTLGPEEPIVPDDDNIYNDTELDWT